jgi:(p)ppGpp synthase/HD superfamily hydrolase
MPDQGTRLGHRFTDAVDMARTVHDGDVRKGTNIPYLAHLLAVAAIVLEHGGNEDDAIAALLHDAAEDHGGTKQIESIRKAFGDDVADIVEACSDTLVENRRDKEPWWDRKVTYLDRLHVEPERAVLVSAADKVHNARTILTDYRQLGDQLWSRFNQDSGRVGTLWYYDRLSKVISRRLEGLPAEALAAELRSVVDELCAVVVANGHDLAAELKEGRRKEAQTRATRA